MLMEYRTLFESHLGSHFRIRFKDGEVYVLRLIRDVSDAAGHPNTWNGFVVGHQGLTEHRGRRVSIGNGLDFRLDDIASVEMLMSP